MTTYRIIRFYEREETEDTDLRGLTLEEAKAHCNDPDTSSETCTSIEGKRRTKVCGRWFDGYTEEK
jgi:hypothetical protein